MSYKKIKMEALDDMKRYYKELSKTEDLEDREFLINGIINIDLKYRDERIFRKMNVEKMREQIADSVYTLKAISNFCMIDLNTLKHFLAGKLPPSKTIKKIYVGIKAYGI